jgi:hypothetical protein
MVPGLGALVESSNSTQASHHCRAHGFAGGPKFVRGQCRFVLGHLRSPSFAAGRHHYDYVFLRPKLKAVVSTSASWRHSNLPAGDAPDAGCVILKLTEGSCTAARYVTARKCPSVSLLHWIWSPADLHRTCPPCADNARPPAPASRSCLRAVVRPRADGCLLCRRAGPSFDRPGSLLSHAVAGVSLRHYVRQAFVRRSPVQLGLPLVLQIVARRRVARPFVAQSHPGTLWRKDLREMGRKNSRRFALTRLAAGFATGKSAPRKEPSSKQCALFRGEGRPIIQPIAPSFEPLRLPESASFGPVVP